MAKVGLQKVETFISRCQNTVAQYIATRPIMDLNLAAKRKPDPRVAMQWWEYESIDLKGMRAAAQEAEKKEGYEEKEDTDGTNTATYD